MMERNYKLPKEGGLEPGADPADIIRKFEKIYTNIYENEASGAMGPPTSPGKSPIASARNNPSAKCACWASPPASRP